MASTARLDIGRITEAGGRSKALRSGIIGSHDSTCKWFVGRGPASPGRRKRRVYRIPEHGSSPNYNHAGSSGDFYRGDSDVSRHDAAAGADGCSTDASAVVIGDVQLGADSSVWPLTVIAAICTASASLLLHQRARRQRAALPMPARLTRMATPDHWRRVTIASVLPHDAHWQPCEVGMGAS